VIEETEEIEAEIEEMTENAETEIVIDQRDVIATKEEEEHHHQANASGAEKQVIGKNNHLR
tara:strand:+ start:123 stop:305 length:183 start_codon:yes stop_codon:yes gene_type:complete